jgi:cation diffusion facilitator CzcD-associated flavoprotein CzcO
MNGPFESSMQRPPDSVPADNELDVVVVGAGLSGIAAAHYLDQHCPSMSWTILESRASIGGTWDLFRYPGVRSDSDMYTLGYSFRPWHGEKAISEGQTILDYIRATAQESGIDRSIRFGQKLVSADWNSAAARWTLRVVRSDADGEHEVTYVCRFLYMCSGYYDYAQGHAPGWQGMNEFQGKVVHPQHWPADLDYAGKRVVVIGSGATAVTLVPALAASAAHVTMLQRSPTYIFSLPSADKIAHALRRFLPAAAAHRIVRAKNVLLSMYFYNFSRRHPEKTRKALIAAASRRMGPEVDAAKHLSPTYAPWDQRLCFVPDGDLFRSVRKGDASIVTDEIARFTPTGIELKSGQTLDADIVVTATGLKVKLVGGATLSFDGAPIDLSTTTSYKGMMFSGVPNLALSFGYTNASWTLKAELIAKYVCRLLNHMTKHGYDACVPTLAKESMESRPFVGLTSGYVQRALEILPKQIDHKAWKVHQNYARDLASLKYGSLEDGSMRFIKVSPSSDTRTKPREEETA